MKTALVKVGSYEKELLMVDIQLVDVQSGQRSTHESNEEL
jgi:hypothetical protein